MIFNLLFKFHIISKIYFRINLFKFTNYITFNNIIKKFFLYFIFYIYFDCNPFLFTYCQVSIMVEYLKNKKLHNFHNFSINSIHLLNLCFKTLKPSLLTANGANMVSQENTLIYITLIISEI